MTETAVPPPLSPPGDNREQRASQGRSSFNRFVIWGLTLLLLLILALVVLVLPNYLGPAEPADVVQAPAAPAVQPEPEASAALAARQEAERALQELLRLRAREELYAVEDWAPEPWADIDGQINAGDAHYGYHRYREAQQAYAGAAEQLIALIEHRPQLLEENLKAATIALGENRVDQAVAGYQRALAIEPGHPLASAGLIRANARNQVLKHMQEGQQAKDDDRIQSALDAFAAASALDSEYAEAASALQEMQDLLQARAFREAMSQGLAEMASGKLEAARHAFAKAEAIYPDDPGLRDARARLAEVRRQLDLKRMREQAGALAREEKWEEAASVYRKALGRDPDAAFAQAGLTHAEQRERLHAQLNHYLGDPKRLYSEEPLNNAKRLLAANSGNPTAEPLLLARLQALRDAVERATVPVILRVESDAMTEVTIYHVGRLGPFLQKELELRPGDYTVVGSRNGYRDVRKVVSLEPGGSIVTVQIRCEEPI